MNFYYSAEVKKVNGSPNILNYIIIVPCELLQRSRHLEMKLWDLTF